MCEMFARRYAPDERQHLSIHHDRSHITMNLLLTDDSDFTGQRYQLSIHAKSGGSLLGFIFLISLLARRPFLC